MPISFCERTEDICEGRVHREVRVGGGLELLEICT